MAAQKFALQPLAAAPTGHCPEVRRARRYLVATHASVGGLIDSFNLVHEQKVAGRTTGQGRLGKDELDLLRAALVFSSSGLDASCHALVSDCVPMLVERKGSTAAKMFDLFLDEQLREPSADFRQAVKAVSPRTQLLRLYVDSKTKASYQGSDDLRDRVKGLLGISNQVLPASRLGKLDAFFIARNDIVHRLDYVDPTSTSQARSHRSPADVVRECDRVLSVVADLIAGAAAIIKKK